MYDMLWVEFVDMLCHCRRRISNWLNSKALKWNYKLCKVAAAQNLGNCISLGSSLRFAGGAFPAGGRYVLRGGKYEFVGGKYLFSRSGFFFSTTSGMSIISSVIGWKPNSSAVYRTKKFKMKHNKLVHCLPRRSNSNFRMVRTTKWAVHSHLNNL